MAEDPNGTLGRGLRARVWNGRRESGPPGVRCSVPGARHGLPISRLPERPPPSGTAMSPFGRHSLPPPSIVPSPPNVTPKRVDRTPESPVRRSGTVGTDTELPHPQMHGGRDLTPNCPIAPHCAGLRRAPSIFYVNSPCLSCRNRSNFRDSSLQFILRECPLGSRASRPLEHLRAFGGLSISGLRPGRAGRPALPGKPRQCVKQDDQSHRVFRVSLRQSRPSPDNRAICAVRDAGTGLQARGHEMERKAVVSLLSLVCGLPVFPIRGHKGAGVVSLGLAAHSGARRITRCRGETWPPAGPVTGPCRIR